MAKLEAILGRHFLTCTVKNFFRLLYSPQQQFLCAFKISSNKLEFPSLQSHSDLCSGCDEVVTDRYLLKVADTCWHVRCLKCCLCQCDLGLETSCYTKDRKIYCKADYARWARCGNTHESYGVFRYDTMK